MTQAVGDFLDSLPPELSRQACLPFDDGRYDWAFYPREMAGKVYPGVPLYALTPEQRILAMKLARTGLSSHAFSKVSVIMSFENALNDKENYVRAGLRDPLRYWVAIYGEPGDRGTWSWKFEGHHVAVNNTIRDGEVLSSTPLFLGANPAEIGGGTHPIIRPCGEEEDAGRELFMSLDTDQKGLALLDATAPIDTVVPNVPLVPELSIPGDPPADLAMFQDVHEAMTDEQKHNLRLVLAEPRGISGDRLDGSQTKLLRELVEVYIGRLPEHLALNERAKLDASGWNHLHFAWAGPPKRREKHYYRIQGPSFMVEYNCVQDDGKHIHAVWRNPQGDFGEDILKSHLAREH